MLRVPLLRAERSPDTTHIGTCCGSLFEATALFPGQLRDLVAHEDCTLAPGERTSLVFSSKKLRNCFYAERPSW